MEKYSSNKQLADAYERVEFYRICAHKLPAKNALDYEKIAKRIKQTRVNIPKYFSREGGLEGILPEVTGVSREIVAFILERGLEAAERKYCDPRKGPKKPRKFPRPFVRYVGELDKFTKEKIFGPLESSKHESDEVGQPYERWEDIEEK